ncbi:assimilatory nitrate reductase catalytic subunit NasC [Paenibacillus glycanilyticus]|uniref:Assimilatory nitrate reductase catalytic subunit n=1 Tax=Paenibacillus glycanilyticus TaxID=126569 RepID=A0ABQ6GJI8_9BACL|nr:nitrate reductase [Paenibacillus glycanilyticus]GLX69217.1 assimilatory nitrate reductase catalytic subunit [Paenibacillus glycanilyticus]
MERQIDTMTFSVEQANKIMATQCPFCSVQCKMEVVEDLSGSRPAYQVTAIPNKASEGRLCVKGMNAYQHAVSRERLLHPMMRKDGALTRVSWEEALEAVSSRFTELQTKHGADTIGLYGGGSLTNESAYLLGKFARVALKTKYIDYNGRFCMSAAASAGVKTFGIDRGLTFAMSDIPMAECIILAGTNIAECQPTLMPYFTRAKDNGAVIIAIDPRASATVSIADIHLQVKPGMDAALVNAMLKVIVDEKLTDEEFIRNRTKGFDAVKEHVSSLNLEEIADYTGVSIELIRKAAIQFGKARTGMVFTARGVEQHADGHMAVRNFLNMVLATGKIGRAGCGYGAVTGQGNGQGGREHGQKADQLPGYRLIENPDDRAYVAGVWGIDPNDLPGKGVSAYEMMELVHGGTIKGLFVMGSNPIVSNPNATLVEEALERAEFLVVADMFLSETAKLADIVLPVSAYLENEGTMTNLEGRVLLRPAGRSAPGEVRHDWQILCDLAYSLGKEQYFPFRQSEEIFNELRVASRGGIADYYGITYDRLRKEEGIYWPCPALDHPGTPRLFGERFAHQDGLAVFQQVDHQSPAEQPSEEYPLYLTNGRLLSHYLTGVQTRRSPVLAAREIENVLEIHPLTARKHRLEDGALASVRSSRGTVIVRTKFTSAIREDTLFIPMHWGDAQNVNRVTNDLLDPNCRMPDFKTSAVRIQPLAEYLLEQKGRMTN